MQDCIVFGARIKRAAENLCQKACYTIDNKQAGFLCKWTSTSLFLQVSCAEAYMGGGMVQCPIEPTLIL